LFFLKETWIDAKAGLFNINPNINESSGFADFEWLRFKPYVTGK
jgi:hypothetical protein